MGVQTHAIFHDNFVGFRELKVYLKHLNTIMFFIKIMAFFVKMKIMVKVNNNHSD
jgi:hypothetical protein